ncbi:aminotransferase class V-fold PLP-dependent enzyme [Planctomycetes bacterium K23_9]|uniref:cysteine desulfurase n=1 Tax=Stieleria marina TaxID=1930275 RepID=A0A517NWZ1_9BACT|nr:putative cysteine desulfurase [Planctomycetes bacterium K23_9]
MSDRPRIYLDHAATSWPKQASVLDAVDAYARNVGASAGRGAYRSSMQASTHIQSARRSLAKLLNVPSSDCVSLHTSGTAALNAVIFGLVSPGDHVVTTATDHNSVLRPLQHLCETAGVELSIAECDAHGQVSAGAVLDLVRKQTRMVILSHASNVTGAVQPIETIGQTLAETSTLFVVDAAQTLGHLPIDVMDVQCDALASPGHKAIGGPLGTGLLYLASDLHAAIRPTIFGGTGSHSESLEMPSRYPDKLEAGNLNVPAIAGLAVAAQSTLESDQQQQRSRLSALSQLLHEGISSDGISSAGMVTVHSIAGPLPVASLSIDGLPASDVAAILDAEFGIETRAGFHCAAKIQDFLGNPTGGTLRISASSHTPDGEIEAATKAIREIAGT